MACGLFATLSPAGAWMERMFADLSCGVARPFALGPCVAGLTSTHMPKDNDRDRWASPWTYEARLGWSGILRVALQQLGGRASLQVLHAKLETELLPRTQLSTQTRKRIRDALAKDPQIRRMSPRIWQLVTEPLDKRDAKRR